VEARFSVPSRTAPRPTPASCTKGTGTIPRVKRTGRGQPAYSSAEVANGLELHLCAPPPTPLARHGGEAVTIVFKVFVIQRNLSMTHNKTSNARIT